MGALPQTWVEMLVALAPLVVLPLALPGVVIRHRSRRTPGRGLFWIWAVAAAAFASSAFVPAVRGEAAVAYFFLATAIAAYGALRFATRSAPAVEELAIDVALMSLAVGAAWWMAYANGWIVLGFSGIWSALTAAHFHFAGFGLLCTVGFCGRKLSRDWSGTRRWLWVRCSSIGLIVALGLLAIGIGFSRPVEIVGVTLYAVLLPIVCWLLVATARRESGLPQLAMLASAVCLLASTALAVGWGIFRLDALSLERMIAVHGTLNAVGAVGLGLTALCLSRPEPRIAPAGLPVSRLRAGPRVGADFFDAVAGSGDPPAGLAESFSDYAHPALDTARIHPEVRRFYEKTIEYDMTIVPSWRFGFRTGARVWRALSRWLGQLNLPVGDPGELTSDIVSIDDRADGRSGVRGWVRCYRSTGRPVYVAAYAVHSFRGIPYMNIAFPLPGSNLTSVLRLDHDPDTESGLQLSTRSSNRDCAGDQGVYLVTPWSPLRLPLDETLQVWHASDVPPDQPQAHDQVVLRCRHQMWLFGLAYLELQYYISRR